MARWMLAAFFSIQGVKAVGHDENPVTFSAATTLFHAVEGTKIDRKWTIVR